MVFKSVLDTTCNRLNQVERLVLFYNLQLNDVCLFYSAGTLVVTEELTLFISVYLFCRSGSSCVLTRNGFGFYQSTPSQLEKFSLCAASHGRVACALELKEGMRPVEVKAEEPVAEKVDEKTEDEPKNEEPVTNGEPAKNEEQEPKM